MNDSQYAVFNQLVPIKKDFQQFARIYKHKDSTTTVAGKQKADKKDKRDRDKRKRHKRDRQVQREHDLGNAHMETVSVETLADGRILVTHITWAEK